MGATNLQFMRLRNYEISGAYKAAILVAKILFLEIVFPVVGYCAIVTPFFLYAAALANDIRFSREQDYTTFILSNFILLVIIVTVLVLLTVLYIYQSPFRRTIFDKIRLTTKGSALFLPLVASAIIFYIPLLGFAFWNNLGREFKDGFITASPIVQSSFAVYLTVLSVLILIRYFFITATMHTSISDFARILTAELEKVAARREGEVYISLPWLAFGKISLRPVLFERFRRALESCITAEGVDMTIQTMNKQAITKMGQQSVDSSPLSRHRFQQFVECEDALRALAKLHNKTPSCVGKAKLAQCVIIGERRMFLLTTLFHSAQNEGHLGRAFLSVEVHDSMLCSEFRNLFPQRNRSAATA